MTVACRPVRRRAEIRNSLPMEKAMKPRAVSADGEGDETQSRIRQQTHGFHHFKGFKTQTGHLQPAQKQGTDQKSSHQIAGDVRQIPPRSQSGQKQTGKHGTSDCQQKFHKKGLFSALYIGYIHYSRMSPGCKSFFAQGFLCFREKTQRVAPKGQARVWAIREVLDT